MSETSSEAAVTVYTELALRGGIPSVVQITPGHCPDVAFLDDRPLDAGAIYIMDRGYIDFTRFSLTLLEKMPISRAVFDVGSRFEDMGAGNQLQLSTS